MIERLLGALGRKMGFTVPNDEDYDETTRIIREDNPYDDKETDND